MSLLFFSTPYSLTVFLLLNTLEYGRKEFLLFGTVGLTACNFLLMMSAFFDNKGLSFISCMFVLIHSSSNGPTSYFFI
jgi:hypothetical protein